jgi:hypothetical protein
MRDGCRQTVENEMSIELGFLRLSEILNVENFLQVTSGRTEEYVRAMQINHTLVVDNSDFFNSSKAREFLIQIPLLYPNT